VTLRIITRSAEETRAAAAAFARNLRRGDCVALSGALGTGKTQFVKGVCERFAVGETVASPTYVLMNRYGGRDDKGREILLYHFDLYRIRYADEVHDLGAAEFIGGDGISMIEWSDRFPEILPARRYDVRLSSGSSQDMRTVEIVPVGVDA